jgi:hypothetical protein
MGVQATRGGDVEPPRERIEDLMRRYGYDEDEAEGAYYLREAWDRFTKMYQNEADYEAVIGEALGTGGGFPRTWAQMFLMSNVHPHFQALSSLLAKRVLGRDYPEGWGPGPAPEEGQPD